MSVKAKWLGDEKQILVFTYSGQWQWQEAFEMMEEAPAMMDEAEGPVAVIVDMTTGRQLPPDPLNYIPRLSQGRGKSKNDSGITFFLNADVLTKAIQDVIEMTNMPIPEGLIAVYARTMEEAIEKAKYELKLYKEKNA